MWPDRRLLDLLDIELPLIQAPMAGANGAAMAAAVCAAGGLGSLPCATIDAERARAEIGVIRQRTDRPFNINFFCHAQPAPDAARQAAWRERLAGFYAEFGLDAGADAPAVNREPFGEAMCALIEEARPKVASFHFGLPDAPLLERVKAAGCVVMASATTVAEARWLEARGCDVIIAQGVEAGGHRGMFLSDDIAGQPGTFALVPQVVDAVSVPVVAAGGVGDGRAIAAAFALGASAAQVGTAYLFTPEATVTPMHRAALAQARDDATRLTNLFTGRPARGLVSRVMRELGPMSDLAPAFPTAGHALAPLKGAAESRGSADFSSLWAGEAAALGREMDAGALTRHLADEALECLARLRGPAQGAV